MRGKIMIIDDDKSMCDMLEISLRKSGFKTDCFTSADNAYSRLMEENFDVVLTDLNMPGVNGIEFCKRVSESRADVPVIVITAFGNLETAIAAIRAGVYDFITKPVDTDLLALVLDRAIKYHTLQEQVKTLNEAIRQSHEMEGMTGESSVMQKLFSEIAAVADTETTVLISGESGSGKELVARALHKQSRRKESLFIAVNCAALPETLLESELFGYKRGAFTDAKNDHKGMFMQADGGTLFLDEIGDIPLSLQPKLLRALEERTVRPVGSSKEETFNVRLITATNSDLESRVEEGLFRDDLFYRINVIQLKVPPLRLRGTDILILADRFIKQFSARLNKKVTGVSKPAMEKLLDYAWPGNVRELRNAIERAVALTNHEKLIIDDFTERIVKHANERTLMPDNNLMELVTMEEMEHRYILHVLKNVDNNRSLAAKLLGMDRKTLYNKLNRYGI